MARQRPQDRKRRYNTRMMGALASALFVCGAAVNWWPSIDDGPDDRIYAAVSQPSIQIEEVVQTRQTQSKPPPPPPVPPVVRPDDELLEEDLAFDNNMLEVQNLVDEAPQNPGPSQATTGPQVSVGPKAVRIVQPEYTRDAQRRKVRAEVTVEVLVSARGTVERASILQRYLVDKKATRQPVESLGYGLEEAALAAAEDCLFRPGREDGRPVRTVTTLTFSFGL